MHNISAKNLSPINAAFMDFKYAFEFRVLIQKKDTKLYHFRWNSYLNTSLPHAEKKTTHNQNFSNFFSNLFWTSQFKAMALRVLLS